MFWKQWKLFGGRRYSGRTLLSIAAAVAIGGFSFGFLMGSTYPKVLGLHTSRPLPTSSPTPDEDATLRLYSIQNLQTYPYQISEITLERVMERRAEYTSYVFSYKTLGKKMTGQVHVPTDTSRSPLPVILLIRGYVDRELYQTGSGTSFAAAEFAKRGYVTIAPDFLGFGGSSSAGSGWEERFEKPVNVAELILSLRAQRELRFTEPAKRNSPAIEKTVGIDGSRLGMWAHSNGGQISLTTLEAMGEAIPITLWAPVTAPFPHSILYYADEMDDGGRGMRSALAGFESRYNVQEYSLTQYINRLRGPIQLHQGGLDDAVPQKWSDAFAELIKKENERRRLERVAEEAKIAAQLSAAELLASQSATPSAAPTLATGSAVPSPSISSTPTPQVLGAEITAKVVAAENAFSKPIEFSYFVYPQADHGLFPEREQVIARDLEFFDRHLRQAGSR